ncbi:MAG: UbiA prenyltransferase family protein [Sandaracinaceae bacterium]|nr:UbiA prenyltransferase family protein [Sandaracinaceae bacterium]
MIRGLLRTMRPQQWVKNLFVLAPFLYYELPRVHETGTLHVEKLLGALAGFVCFSLLASAVYVLNDVVDVEADRAHPVKRNRPIPAGVVSLAAAKVAMAALALAALGGGYFLGWLFLGSLAGYIVNNVAYSFGLKRLAYVDVLSIAIGFELRVLAGSFAADVPPSHYLLIVTFVLAMFLGLGKRMHELVQQEKVGSSKTREVLARYNKRAVNLLLLATGAGTVGTYVVYSLDPSTRDQFGTDYLVLSSVFVLLGVLRFVQLVRTHPEIESPTEQMLRDVPFIVTGLLGAASLVLIVYFT